MVNPSGAPATVSAQKPLTAWANVKAFAWPVVALLAGALSGILWMNSANEARAYPLAAACTQAEDPGTANCYRDLGGTVLQANVETVRGSTRIALRVQLTAGAYWTSVTGQGDAGRVLVPGADISGRLYHDRVVQLVAGYETFPTGDRPRAPSANQGLTSLLFAGLGAIGIGFEGFRRLHRRPVALASPVLAVGSVPSLTVAKSDVDALLRAEQLRHPQRIGLPLVIHPQSRNMTLPLWVGLVPGLFLVGSLIVQLHLRGLAIAIAIGVALALAALIVMLRRRYFNRAALVVDEQEVAITPAYGKRKAASRGQVARVVLRRIAYRNNSTKRLIVVDHQGRTLLRASGEGYSYDDAAAFAVALGVPVDGNFEVTTSAVALALEFPGAVSGIERHPMLLGFAMVTIFTMGFLVYTFAGK